jgi:hypothetical protein
LKGSNKQNYISYVPQNVGNPAIPRPPEGAPATQGWKNHHSICKQPGHTTGNKTFHPEASPRQRRAAIGANVAIAPNLAENQAPVVDDGSGDEANADAEAKSADLLNEFGAPVRGNIGVAPDRFRNDEDDEDSPVGDNLPSIAHAAEKVEGRVMGLDNWYTSLEVAVILTVLGIGFVGIIKTNRKGIPPKQQRRTLREAKVFTLVGITTTYSTLIGGMREYFTCRMNKKPVHVLSSFPSTLGRVKREAVDALGNFTEIDIVRPVIFAIYNIAMWGTDLHDQLNSYFETVCWSYKWPFRIFTHFIGSAMTNAIILFRMKHGTLKRSMAGTLLFATS